MKLRLDTAMLNQGLVSSRSHASRLIRLNKVTVEGKLAEKPGQLVSETAKLKLKGDDYVSRAAYKLKSAVDKFKFSFKDKLVLDIGSSTGGFTDFALQKGAKKVIAVDVGTDQMSTSLRSDERIELHEKTDIRDWLVNNASVELDVILVDVSFISLREILPKLLPVVGRKTQVIAMLKPQFEAGANTKHKGVIKNSKMRRDIVKSFELWLQKYFVIMNKADSEVTGQKGNIERFYLLQQII